MKMVRIHKLVAGDIKNLRLNLKIRVSELLDLLAAGEGLGMPMSRPMPNIDTGVHELRLKDSTGQYRVFYYTKVKGAILVFHFFKKKTQTTPKKEFETAKNRLRSML